MLNENKGRSLITQTEQKNFYQGGGSFFNLDSYSRTQYDRYYELAEKGYAFNSCVYKCVSMIANAAAALPFKVMRQGKMIDSHEIIDVLKRPNSDQSCFEFFNLLYTHLLIGGNAYIYSAARLDGKHRRLRLLRPDLVRVNVVGNQKRYTYSPDKTKVDSTTASSDVEVLNPKYLKHIKLPNPLSDLYGLAPLASAIIDVDHMNMITKYANDTLLNGGIARFWMEWMPTDQNGKYIIPSEEDREKKRNDLRTNVSGINNTNKVGLLVGQHKIHDVVKSPRDSEHSKGKEMAMRDIGNVFHISPQMLGIPGSMTFKNMDSARKSMYEEGVFPYCHKVISDLNEYLAMQYEGEGLEIIYDFTQCPAAKETWREDAEILIKLVEANIYTINRARNILGEPDIAGGDVLRIDSRKLPVDMDVPMEIDEDA